MAKVEALEQEKREAAARAEEYRLLEAELAMVLTGAAIET